MMNFQCTSWGGTRNPRFRALWGGLGWWLVSVLFIVGANSAKAQSDDIEPHAFRLQITGVHTGILVNAERNQIKSAGATQTDTYDHLFAGPVFGLDATGSVYHPNLLEFTLGGEFSPGYDLEKSSSQSNGTSRRTVSLLGNYTANFAFLSQKPYRFNLFAGQNYGYREYDFFNQVQVSSVRYGGNFGYQSGPVPFNLSVWRQTQDTYDEILNTSIQETGLSLSANNRHKWGQTSLAYGLNQSNRGDYYALGSDTTQYFSAGDVEAIKFGSREQFNFNTDLGYTRRESSLNPSEDMHALTTLTIQHTPTLFSSYDAEFNRATSSAFAGSSQSDSLSGGASLHHQLYRSLTSTLHIQGLETSTQGSFEGDNGENQTSTSKESRFGGGIDEQYTKRLGSLGRLTMGASLLLEHSTVDNGGADMVVIVGESHSFASNGSGGGQESVNLNLPYVDEGSIVIRDGTNSVLTYQKGIDYTISTNGSITEIRRVAIPQNAPILVDYRAHAINSGEYNTVTGGLNIRIDLWKGLLAVYGRYHSMQNTESGDHSAPGALQFSLANMEGYAVGAETSWRRLRAGVEYNAEDSTYSSYRTTRLFQSVAFQPDAASALNFDLLESQTQYIDTNRSERDYTIMSRYSRTLTSHLGMHLDAGVDLRRGDAVDETRFTVRPGFELSLGRLELRMGYSYEYSKFLNSTERTKNMLFISGRRNF